MNSVMKINADRLMSSQEIAELTGKRHDHVIRDIRTMVDALQKDAPVLGHKEYQDVRGYTSGFALDRDLTLTLITGYDPVARLKVIRRWQALEVPQTYAQALRAHADAVEKAEVLKAQIEEQAPMVMLAEAVMASDEEMSITAAAKHFGWGRKKFFELLQAAKAIIKRTYYDGRAEFWEAKQTMIDNGYMTVRQVPDANGVYRPQTFITGRGLQWCNALVKTA